MRFRDFHIEQDLKVSDTMPFEDLYPEKIRLRVANKILFKDATYHLVLNNGDHVTEIIICNLDAVYDSFPPGHKCEEYRGTGSLYLYRITTKAPFQNKGYGKILMGFLLHALFLQNMTQENMATPPLLGHFMENSYSIKTAEYFGGERITDVKNWGDTGENFVLCSIPI
jgi:hypothetical protein